MSSNTVYMDNLANKLEEIFEKPISIMTPPGEKVPTQAISDLSVVTSGAYPGFLKGGGGGPD